MDETLRELLRELAEQGAANDARETDRARHMLNLDPETAQLMSLLVRSSGATQVLEVGTSNGYSTIWLAWSVSVTHVHAPDETAVSAARFAAGHGAPFAGSAAAGTAAAASAAPQSAALAEAAIRVPVPRVFPGRVTSIDCDPNKQTLARENLLRAGLLDRVDLLHGDATQLIRELSGPFDFVFFDADRASAPEQLQLLLPKLSAKSLVLHDNALSHPDQIAGYLEMLDSLPEFQHVVVPIGKGLSIAFRG